MVLIKFGTLRRLGVELRAKSYEMWTNCRERMHNAHGKFLEYTRRIVTNAISIVYDTLDYEYRHKNKGTDLALVLRKCGVYTWDQESYKMCTVLIDMNVHTKYSSSHTEVTNAMPTVYTTLDYGYRHKNKGIGLILVPRKCGVYKWDQKSY